MRAANVLLSGFGQPEKSHFTFAHEIGHHANGFLNGNRWIDAVLPFASQYKPFWLGLGALAFDLMLAVIITSLLRVRIGHRVWRAVHWMAYALWPIAVIHGLGTGSDSNQPWMLILDAACIATVAAAVFARFVGDATTDRANTGKALVRSHA